MPDQLIRATAANGGIRAVGVLTTDLTETARQRHSLSYLATAALGRSMAAGLLLASSMKQPQSRVNLRIKGTGPLGSITVDAGLNGTVRGYVTNPSLELPPNAQGKLDLGGAIGAGYLHVTRDLGQGTPYTGTVELVSGEIGEDVTYYLAHSEQTPSALVVGVYSSQAGVEAAGGLLIQILPKISHDETLIELLESRLASLSGFTALLRSGQTLPEILQTLLGDLDLEMVTEPQPLSFWCPCSRDRVQGALTLLGAAELRDMIATDGGAEVTCDFCNEVYRLNVEDLETLALSLEVPPSTAQVSPSKSS